MPSRSSFCNDTHVVTFFLFLTDAKSIVSTSQRTSGMMHDYPNNTYHSQPSRRHNACSAPPLLTTGLSSSRNSNSASCGSPFPFGITAESSTTRPSSTPAYYRPHLLYEDDDDEDGDEDDGIDYNSLFEAMNDSPGPTPTANLHQHQLQPDGQDSLDTMLSYLRKNDDLVQHMDTIEQLENISFLRVMYLGVTSAEERRLFLKKLSDGLSETFFRQTPVPSLPHVSTISSATASSDTTNSSSNSNSHTHSHSHSNSSSKHHSTPPSYGFRERRHHLLPLHLFFAQNDDQNSGSRVDDSDYDDDDNHTAMFEENGVSIVEADFTTDNQHHFHRHDTDLILHYVYTQFRQSHPSTSLRSILNIPPHWEHKPFNGHVFSEGAPAGIDLCVYFYHDAQGVVDVIKDMDLLWKINALHIPILPIMSMSNQVPISSQPSATTPLTPSAGLPSPRLPDHSSTTASTSYLQQRSIDIRRTELAHIFSQWRIKMMDISNLDKIGQPSFQQKGSSRHNSTQEDRMIEERLGQAWASSSITSPTPYHILTLFQFVAMDRWAVSKLLKTIMDQAEERRHLPLPLATTYQQAATTTGLHSPPPFDDTLDDCQHNKLHLPAHEASKSPTSSVAAILTNMINSLVGISLSDPTKGSLSTSSSSSSSSSTNTTTTTSTLQDQDPLSHHDFRRPFYTFPFLLLAAYGLWVTLVGMVMTRQRPLPSPWHASLVMVSHQGEHSMTLMVNVYDGQDQPRWAPEPPLLTTNLPLSSSPPPSPFNAPTTTLSPKPMAAPPVVVPLPNKTHHSLLEGQYFYSIGLPRCHTLDPGFTYTIKVLPSTTLPSVQGSPLHIPRYVLCDPSSSSSSTDTSEEPAFMEAWHHFRRHTRFYLRNSAKIMEMIFTEGKEKD